MALAASSCLLLSIAVSWVGVAQLARAAEVDAERLQHCSVVPLLTWANATAWIALALPYVLRRLGDPTKQKGGCGSLVDLVTTPAFQLSHPPRFLFIALTTNFSYIGALHFLPASLNTAIFSSSPVFTLLFQVLFLDSGTRDDNVQPALQLGKALSVGLSVVGVLLIAQPWHSVSPGGDLDQRSRILGVLFSLAAAVGTAIYQVYFKKTFGDSMQPTEVGLFLAHMGCWASVLMGSSLYLVLAQGTYKLDLSKVPWVLVVLTALCSALFNYLIKFGLSRETPVTTSLGTQIGIPLNFLLDVLVVHSQFRWPQALGVLTMLLSFSVWHHSEVVSRAATPGQVSCRARLLEADGAVAASVSLS